MKMSSTGARLRKRSKVGTSLCFGAKNVRVVRMKPSYDDRNITPSSWVSAKLVTARYGALRSSCDEGEMSRSREPSIRDAQQDGTPPTLKLASGRWSYKQSIEKKCLLRGAQLTKNWPTSGLPTNRPEPSDLRIGDQKSYTVVC